MIFFMPASSLPPLTDELFWSFQFRERYERRDNADFTDATNDNNGKWFTRARLGLTFDAGDNTKVHTTYQYTNAQVIPMVGAESQATGQDLVEAYLQHTNGGSTLTLGRQKLNKGRQRMLGALEWANSSRSWLGARVQNGDWDYFWGNLAVNPSPNFNTELAMIAKKGEHGETMLAYKHNNAGATQSVYMLDHRWVSKMGGMDFDVEGAYQWGQSGGLDHDAWAVSARVTKKFDEDWSGYVEANVATGGQSATKNRRFDNFYPTNHLYYGFMDRQGLTNMTGFSLGVNWQMQSDMSFAFAYHTYSLYDDTDGWFGAGGGMNTGPGGNYIDPAGASGSNVGSEFNATWKWKLARGQSLEAGMGIYDAGGFTEAILGASADQNFWGYASYGFRF